METTIQERHKLTMNPNWLVAFDVLGRRESPLEEFAPFDAQQSFREFALKALRAGGNISEEEIAAAYQEAESAGLEELAEGFRDMTAAERESIRSSFGTFFYGENMSQFDAWLDKQCSGRPDEPLPCPPEPNSTRFFEITLPSAWLVTLDVLARREQAPASWPPGKPCGPEEQATFAKQQPCFHKIVLETLRETLPDEDISALYDNAERLSLDELRARFKELTAGREPGVRKRHEEEARKIARAHAFYNLLGYSCYEFEGGGRHPDDPFEDVRESIRGLLDTLCP